MLFTLIFCLFFEFIFFNISKKISYLISTFLNPCALIHLMQFRRKLYTRGSSYETTIPKPLLFALNLNEHHDVLFTYDAQHNRWVLSFEKQKDSFQKNLPKTSLLPSQVSLKQHVKLSQGDAQ